jgi:hypothetical protein
VEILNPDRRAGTRKSRAFNLLIVVQNADLSFRFNDAKPIAARRGSLPPSPIELP